MNQNKDEQPTVKKSLTVQTAEEIIDKAYSSIEKPFVTAQFGDDWKACAKENYGFDDVIDIAWKQGRFAVLLKRAITQLFLSSQSKQESVTLKEANEIIGKQKIPYNYPNNVESQQETKPDVSVNKWIKENEKLIQTKAKKLARKRNGNYYWQYSVNNVISDILLGIELYTQSQNLSIQDIKNPVPPPHTQGNMLGFKNPPQDMNAEELSAELIEKIIDSFFTTDIKNESKEWNLAQVDKRFGARVILQRINQFSNQRPKESEWVSVEDIHRKVQDEINNRLDILDGKIKISDYNKESRSCEAGAFNEIQDFKDWFIKTIITNKDFYHKQESIMDILNSYCENGIIEEMKFNSVKNDLINCAKELQSQEEYDWVSVGDRLPTDEKDKCVKRESGSLDIALYESNTKTWFNRNSVKIKVQYWAQPPK